MTGCWRQCVAAKSERCCLWRRPGLARNGREWHTLIDYCGLVGCLLADVGYVRVDRDRIGMDPDQRVRETVALVFRKFAEFGSIRQVHLWLCQEGVELPAVVFDQSQRRVVWKLPGYTTVHRILTNPVYAGAYAFGRTGSRTYLENGRKRVVRGFRRERDEWEVLIRDHHDGYITWTEYERNQKVVGDNANCQGAMVRGSIRKGEALLAGLLRCGHCGRKLHVGYSGTQGNIVRYQCRGAHINHGNELCISFGGLRVDRAEIEEIRRLAEVLDEPQPSSYAST